MMPAYDYDLVSIGSGPAGQRAAVQAAKLGKRAAVVEKLRCVGGVCLGTGTIPSKTLREAVLSFSRSLGRPGPGHASSPVARPSAEQLLARVEEVLAREQEVIEDQLLRNDVVTVRGEASFTDPHTLAVRREDGWQQISAGTIVIAVGTQPAPPPGIAADGEVVITSDDVVRLRQVPRAMTVVGASVIGIEYASMFSVLGVPVTLIEKRTRPLEFLDREIVDELIHQMRTRNVTFRLGETVAAIEIAGAPRRAIIHLESGKRLVSDVVLFSAGRIAATKSSSTVPSPGISSPLPTVS